ncbi:MAG: acyltransferase [Victivallales bacterium]|nr:acyltransferase [Victivallales bacterium]
MTLRTPSPIRQLARESNFELLRLVSQFCIVLYHIIHFYVVPFRASPWFEAVQMPLHVGVVVFVLLSGYFGIKPSSKGLFRLLSILLVYSLTNIIFGLRHGDGLYEKALALCFLSRTPFWFVRTYVYLYLVSPILNDFLGRASSKQKWYILLALGFISVVIAQSRGDFTLEEGKNLGYFMFLYCLGQQLHEYKGAWQNWSTSKLLLAYLLLNIAIVSAYLLLPSLHAVTWKLCFYYTSPLLITNAVLLFLLFGKIRLQSAGINWLATSCLAIFLIHCSVHAKQLLHLVGKSLCQHLGDDCLLFCATVVLALLVVGASILIDKLLTPVWLVSGRLGTALQKKLGF